MRRLLDDLRALEQMIEGGVIETDVRRIGAEQELFLVASDWRPAMASTDLLERVDDQHFTTELGLFQAEINLDPQPFGGSCLRVIETQLEELLTKLHRAAKELDIELVLTGVLPSIRKSDLGPDSMTPLPRYQEIARATNALRGGDFEVHIRGIDDLIVKHDSVMLESCNASFQIHFQVGPEEFANLYNIAQVVSAPVLAAAVNSPLLFGQRLWRETRIALFQQAVDTRSKMDFHRERVPRVTFGRQWLRGSALDLIREDVSRYRSLLTTEIESDPLQALARGEAPELNALRLFNSTIYRWNRGCYGITDGKPHLRIENRILPAGPTVADEMANAALWFGLIAKLSSEFEDVSEHIDFEDVRTNFLSAARLGLKAQFSWLSGETLPATRLILDRLIPAARDGLVSRGIDTEDADRYLGVLEKRVTTKRTGAQWTLLSLSGMRKEGSLGERMTALTAAMVARQRDRVPVSDWELADLKEGGGWQRDVLTVEQYMTTDLYTVHEDESLDLVANLMEWKRIRHVPVEDHDHRLVGLISYRSLLKLLATEGGSQPLRNTPVAGVMKRDPVTITPEASIQEAFRMLREEKIASLPVVKKGKLIGIITERDLMRMGSEVLDELLRRFSS